MHILSILIFSLCPLGLLLVAFAWHRRTSTDEVIPYPLMLFAFLWGSVVAPQGAMFVVRGLREFEGALQSVLVGPAVEELFKCGGILWLCAAYQPSERGRFWVGLALGVGFSVTENFLAFASWQGAGVLGWFSYVVLRISLPTLMHGLTGAFQAWLPGRAESHELARWLGWPAAACLVGIGVHAIHNAVVFSLPAGWAVGAAVMMPFILFYSLTKIYFRTILRAHTQRAALAGR